MEPSRFALIVTLWGYEASIVTPVQPTSSRTFSYHFAASVPMTEKKEENR
jgi:hypothetical protein